MNFVNLRLVFTAGFALFAMFFGSGNLLYPLAVGVSSKNGFFYALLGLLTAGVFFPFLGLVATMASTQRKEDFFSPLGKPVALAMGLLTLSLMGPFGVGARCVLVARAGMSLVFPQVPIELLGFIFLFSCGFLLLRKGNVVNVIGRFLTPLLLAGLITIILVSFFSPGSAMESTATISENLRLGALQGYQMMDLLAAIFFGHSIYMYLQKSLKNHSLKEGYKLSLAAGILGASMLALLYAGLVAMGAHHAADLQAVDPEQHLATIAHIVLGPVALVMTSSIVALACLTTLCVLMELFADFLRFKLLPKDSINRTNSILVTLSITFFVSLAGFFTLATWIGMALKLIYPALIVFSLLRLLQIKNYLSERQVQIFSALALVFCFFLVKL